MAFLSCGVLGGEGPAEGPDGPAEGPDGESSFDCVIKTTTTIMIIITTRPPPITIGVEFVFFTIIIYNF